MPGWCRSARNCLPFADAELVIPAGGVVYNNVWRDFGVIAKHASVTPYPKPIHSLRKSCLTDWAGRFPAHVVKEWAGHGDIRTTLKYYLKVSEMEYERAAGLSTGNGAGEQQGTAPAQTDFDAAFQAATGSDSDEPMILRFSPDMTKK